LLAFLAVSVWLSYCQRLAPKVCNFDNWRSIDMGRLIRSALILAAVLAVPLRGYATDLTIDNGNLGATVKFSASGGNLIVTLTNGAIDNPNRSAQILSAVYFDVAGDPDLHPVSAVICATCSITAGGTTGPGGSVGGEWGFKVVSDGGLEDGASYGVSAVSLGGFGTKDLFGGTNLSGTAGPGGIDYGITTLGDQAYNDNSTLLGVPLVVNQVIFTLSGLPAGFDPSVAISNVNFNYGTTNSPTPEPTSLALLGLGGATAWIIRRRKKVTPAA
jgi:hypothetical protein